MIEVNTHNPTWLEVDHKYLPLHYQVMQLLDLMMSTGLSQHKLLRGSGLFYEDLQRADIRLSPAQIRVLIQNAIRLLPNNEISFRWGSRFWPGFAGASSQALAAAVNLNEALQLLQQFRYWLSPMLIPKVYMDDDYCYIQWLDTFGLEKAEREFMVNTQMAALVSLIESAIPDARQHLLFCFSAQRPDIVAPYQVYLGDTSYFGMDLDLVAVKKEWLFTPWPAGSERLSQLAAKQAEQECESFAQQSFVEGVYDYLWNRQAGKTAVCLEQTAEYFAISSATFKRKLKKHHLSFQQLHDRVRLNQSLYLMHVRGWTNERIADYLHFGDVANFRRAFKRWTGRTPSDSRSGLPVKSFFVAATQAAARVTSNRTTHTRHKLV